MSKAQEFVFFGHQLGKDYIKSYMDYANNMGLKIVQQEGIIIWGLTKEEVPSDIYFLPAEIQKGQSFDDFVKDRFTDKDAIIYDVIFSPIRANVPDLAGKISSLRYITATFGPYKKPIKISYGKLYFNVTLALALIREWSDDPNLYDISIGIEDREFPLKKMQMPTEDGFTSLFEKMEF